MASTHALAAKEIRKHIKKLGVKASVRAASYAGGNSVYVSTEDLNPSLADEVRKITDQYQMGSFDGMNDFYEIDNERDDIPQVKYVLVSGSFSIEMKQKALDFLLTKPLNGLDLGDIPKNYADVTDYKQLEYINSILYGKSNFLSSEFWEAQNNAKPA